jgi:transcription elongation factor GreA
MQREPMTKYGYKKIQEEIETLSKERVQVLEEIEIARDHGDLKENAEYHAAKERQGFIDKKVAELNSLLTNSEIIDPSTLTHDKVKFGSTVTVLDYDTDEEETFTIVGSMESNSEKNLISIQTPLARALMGKEEGDDFELKLPSKTQEYEIVKIEYQEISFE